MINTIINAIQNNKLLEFYYNNHYRVVEPHTVGVFKTGNEMLVAFQVAGTSDSGKVPDWKQFTLSKVIRMNVLDEHFSGIRIGYKRGDSRFREIFSEL